MKSHWIVSLVLVFSFLAGFLSLPGTAQQIAHAQDTEKLPPEPVAEPETEGPHTCPLIPIAVYGGGALYQAYRYETDDCDPPTITYVYGSHDYPQLCPECGAKAEKAAETNKTSEEFTGLAMPVPAKYKHTMPTGKPDKYSRPALTPDRIEYLYLKKQRVYVRVFAFDVNVKDMDDEVTPNPGNFKKTIYFAFECSDPASVGVNVAEIEAVSDEEQMPVPTPDGDSETVHDVTYEGEDGPVHILTFLCG